MGGVCCFFFVCVQGVDKSTETITKETDISVLCIFHLSQGFS